MIPTSTLERIQQLTKIDLQHKTVFELFTAAGEELGEFARELQIEEYTFGNAFKNPDEEGTRIEAVDMTIMALCLYMARGGTVEELDNILNKKLDKWEKQQKV